VASSVWWHPAVPIVPSDACQSPVAPAGARWPCARPTQLCPSPAVAASLLALLPTVAADQRPDEEPKQAEEQEGPQDGAHDDARLLSSCHGSTACHCRPPRRLPTGHHVPGGTLARRASPQQHPACAASPTVALTWCKAEVELAHRVAHTVGDAALVDTSVDLRNATD